MILIPNYRLRHIPRPRSVRARGGGVGFFVKNGVEARRYAHPPDMEVEQMWLKLSMNGLTLLIGTAYRPPWLSIDTFIDTMTDTISSFSKFDYIVLMGDFNINLLNNDRNASKLKLLFTYFDLKQHIDVPTHFTNNSSALIDVICSNCLVTKTQVNYIPTLSHHAFLSCELNIRKCKPLPQKICFRPLKDIDQELFNRSIESIKWECISELMTVNDMVNTFNCVVLSLLDAYAPQKVILIRERSYPWITPTIKEMMRLRDEAHNTYKASGLDRDKLYYHELKKCVNKALFHETRAYFNQNINQNASNSRALWNNLKRTVRITKKSQESEIPSHLHDPERINLHFLEVAGNVAAPQSYLAKFETSRFHDSTFRLEPVGEDLVLKIIKTLKSSALGDDGN
ncbi:uncharacterized protein LOC133523870 [Cydia pomonella]|uniref:uncharacterized protein LOC133523870 n=1 Tax=Cydia pomonella TaxID=82600 RepID=UPI002ADDB2BF|nr:uncharacterized protein LOC133523870 [Cydia pomonella]